MTNPSSAPLVSILVPVYQVERYMERCARSLFTQTYENLEFLFVDDATPDNSVAILKEVLNDYPKWHNRVKILHHGQNRGLAAARNTLVDNSRGEFLMHVDSDDWVEPDAVELLVKRQVETGADIVTGLAIRHKNVKEKTFAVNKGLEWKDWNKHEALMALLENRSSVAIWKRLIRRSLYIDNGIRTQEGVDMNEDFYVILKLMYYARKAASVNHVIYHYNRENPNSSTKLFLHCWNKQQQAMQATLSNIDFFSDKEPVYRKAMNQLAKKRLLYLLEITEESGNEQLSDMVRAQLDKLECNQ